MLADGREGGRERGRCGAYVARQKRRAVFAKFLWATIERPSFVARRITRRFVVVAGIASTREVFPKKFGGP